MIKSRLTTIRYETLRRKKRRGEKGDKERELERIGERGRKREKGEGKRERETERERKKEELYLRG